MSKTVLLTLAGILIIVIGAAATFTLKNKSTYPLINNQNSCPEPFIFQLPVDISKATSFLYPGQMRGGDYKPHGGFRFDNSKNNEIVVTAPYDAEVIDGARYLVNGEIQYIFDFAHPCGVQYRLGHLLVLTPKFQAIADKFPKPVEMDSRSTQINPPVKVKQGEAIATAVGVTKGGVNTFLDWGVYDYRQKNEASKDSVWAEKHTNETEIYAVCLFEWLSPEDKAKVMALPAADYQSGKTSDYCK